MTHSQQIIGARDPKPTESIPASAMRPHAVKGYPDLTPRRSRHMCRGLQQSKRDVGARPVQLQRWRLNVMVVATCSRQARTSK